MKKTCKQCRHWSDRVTEDDGFEHGRGTHKVDGKLYDIGICLLSGPKPHGRHGSHLYSVKREDHPACELFEPCEEDVLPW